MLNRFAILHHQLSDGEHWDLMLERGDALLTWQLPREPVDRSALPMPARRIGDHRKAYLDYQGPVSGNRGRVRRVDSGTFEFEKLTDSLCVVALNGGRLRGSVRLRALSDGWILEAAQAPPCHNRTI